MTCIVGIVHEDTVYIGADSAGIDATSHAIEVRTDGKVFITESEDIIIGFSGCFRTGQLLQYAFDPPEQSKNQSDMAYMVTDFVDSIRSLLEEKGILKKESEVEENGAEILVGYNGQLYMIDSDFQVACFADKYAAGGAGGPYARGSLFATGELLAETKLSPQQRIRLALRAAAHHCAAVREPFTILSLACEE